MNPPRFLLLLAVHENVLRAALMTRDLKIASAAKQTFTMRDGAFDPAEVWYKMKKVIAACFDIGRTQPRELLAGALVSDERAWCVWQDKAGDVDAAGFFDADACAVPARFREYNTAVMAGTLRAWLLWNLSGAYVLPGAAMPAWRARAAACNAALRAPRTCEEIGADCFGVIRARSPFAEALPIAAMFSENELAADGQGDAAPDEGLIRAAARCFAELFAA